MVKINNLTVATTLLAVRMPVLANRAYAQFNSSSTDKRCQERVLKPPYFRAAPEPLIRRGEVITADIKYPATRHRFDSKPQPLFLNETPPPRLVPHGIEV